jgi:hypothetical protein
VLTAGVVARQASCTVRSLGLAWQIVQVARATAPACLARKLPTAGKNDGAARQCRVLRMISGTCLCLQPQGVGFAQRRCGPPQ